MRLTGTWVWFDRCAAILEKVIHFTLGRVTNEIRHKEKLTWH